MILHTVNQLGKNIDNMFNISHSASNVKLQSIYIAHLESFVNHNSNEIYQICKIETKSLDSARAHPDCNSNLELDTTGDLNLNNQFFEIQKNKLERYSYHYEV